MVPAFCDDDHWLKLNEDEVPMDVSDKVVCIAVSDQLPIATDWASWFALPIHPERLIISLNEKILFHNTVVKSPFFTKV